MEATPNGGVGGGMIRRGHKLFLIEGVLFLSKDAMIKASVNNT